MSSNEIHQSAATLLLRRLVALLGVLAFLAGVVLVVTDPVNYIGWVWGVVGIVVGVLAARRKQQTDDGQLLRRTSLRTRG
ncbi:hypothetical protein [uncultured Pseudokineococcus sp.]|uniref:hypothetical protein n=1 Tax=uncultured Pseudokineococcus sp. TaxID=1642928 RepID=UPI00260172AF|nr:hypothetical protein [uncultured Pseudokineococcus sp.]